MPRSTSALILVLVASPAFAQAFYRWVDAEGTTHYTDNSATIPRGAAVFATEGEPISEMGKAAPVPVVAPKPAAVVDQKGVAVDPDVPTQAEVFWRAQFRAAAEKIRTIEDDIASDRYLTEDLNGLPVSATYFCASPYYQGAYSVPPIGYHPSSAVGRKGGQAHVGRFNRPGYVGNHFNNYCAALINPEYDQAIQRLEKNRSALARAKDDLHDLELRAAFEAVPLEWRR